MSEDASQNSSGNSTKQRGRGQELAPFRWKPGQSGNPGGRPKRKPITDAYRKFLDQIDEKTGLTVAEVLAIAQIREAIKGSHQHAKEITDRVEGSVHQAMDILFGDMSNEDLERYLAEQLADAMPGSDGGETAGDGPGSADPAGTGEARSGAGPGASAGSDVDAAAGTTGDGI